MFHAFEGDGGGFVLRISQGVTLIVPNTVRGGRVEYRVDSVRGNCEKVPEGRLVAVCEAMELSVTVFVEDGAKFEFPLVVRGVPMRQADTFRDLFSSVAESEVESFMGANWAD